MIIILNDELNRRIINKASKKLFYNYDKSLFSEIKDFQYGDYIYNTKNDSVIKKESKCTSENVYVSRLFGYTNNEEEVSMDADIGKLVDGVIYNMVGGRLGSNTENVNELIQLFVSAPYYRYNYVKVNGSYQLKSVVLISRDID